MYLGWYGLGRVFIEGLRTDSLYLMGTNLRVSQLLAGICVVFAVVFLFVNAVFREHDPDDLYVNVVAARAAVEPQEVTDEASGEIVEEPGEEVSEERPKESERQIEE